MRFVDFSRGMNNFVNKLQDKESKAIFDVRFQYFLDRNIDDMEESICDLIDKNQNFRCGWITKYLEKNAHMVGKKFVIFGCCARAKCTIRTLDLMGYETVGIIDNNTSMHGKECINGLIVENPVVLLEKYKDCIIFIATQKKYQIDVYYQLLEYGIDVRRIMMTTEGSLFAAYGRQYFDLEELEIDIKGEIFVDAGCYDGGTAVDFVKWAGRNAKKIIAFEPDEKNIVNCKKRLKKLDCDYELLNIATWDKESVLRFNMNFESGYASKVSNLGNVEVKANSIDNIIGENRVTFIKLDVEGAELKTLQGAIETIKKYKPKLAISLYHKAEDIIEIPLFLEGLDLDYKYYIRHYQTRRCETVLYAI